MSYNQYGRICVSFGLFVICGGIWAVVQSSRSAGQFSAPEIRVLSRTTHSLSSRTPQLYPYSVILGGVRSAGELRLALAKDGVARTHYASFDVDAARPVFAREALLRYVSYRRDNQIYWTAKPLRIPPGELLLTAGENMARARCGNRLSAMAMTPTETHPPPNLDDNESLSFVFGPYPPKDFALPSLGDAGSTTEEASIPDTSEIATAISGTNALTPDKTAVAKAWAGPGDLVHNFPAVTTGGAGLSGVLPRSGTGAASADSVAAANVLTPEPSTAVLVMGGVLLVCLCFFARRVV